MVLRYITSDLPRLDELGVPPVLKDLVDASKRGLILMVGATGSGKSTTLAGDDQPPQRELRRTTS